jgi:2-hydroxy-6-oxonona-2,4-dienedioate hydrolase
MDEALQQLQSVRATIGGVSAHARVSITPAPPDATPIVLVHGLSVSSRYMVPTAKELMPYHRIYAPDLPGFGKSAHPDQILNIPQLADALAEWMDFFDLDRMVLVGNSMGCQIIADFALRRPKRVERMVLIGPTVDRHGRTLLEQARRLMVDISGEPISSILTQTRDYWACGPRRTVGTMRRALADRIEEKLPHLRTPTLIVRGANDPIAPQGWCEELARLLLHGRLVVIPKAPHATNYAAPAALASIILEFMSDRSVEIEHIDR